MSDKKDCAVLFIHGFLGSPDFFNQFISQIPENYVVYNMLLCGHGGEVTDFANASMKLWKSQVKYTMSVLAEKYNKIAIVAHSMGTFFAMELAAAFPGQVKALFLLGSPLKIFVRPIAVTNAAKLLFNLFSEHDYTFLCYKNAVGVRLNMRFWEYIGWIPRYAELFRESRRARKTIKKVNVPCYIFQSQHDEVVSIKSIKFIPEKENIFTTVLKNSSHFIYSDKDFQKIIHSISGIL
ncbi:MAG: alpha/beta fold hydrolase [Clostridia bacterium]|nr:alpha/beta fold hydrolase [Clostridia bacterium]